MENWICPECGRLNDWYPYPTRCSRCGYLHTPEAVPEVKQPWQMTKEEFNTSAYNPPEFRPETYDIKGELTPYGRLGEYVGAMSGKEILALSEQVGAKYVDHYAAIRKALSESKAVPAEVLADYPDLAKVAPKPPVEATGVTPEVTRGFKQFTSAIKTADSIVLQYPKEDIRVFGSLQTFKRAPLTERQARSLLGVTKARPDLDIVVHNPEIESFIKARENQINFQEHDIRQYIKGFPEGYDRLINIEGDTIFRAGDSYYKFTPSGLQWIDNPDLIKVLKEATPIKEVVASFKRQAFPIIPELAIPKAEVTPAVTPPVTERVIPGITSEKQLPKRIIDFKDVDGRTYYEVKVVAPDRVEVSTMRARMVSSAWAPIAQPGEITRTSGVTYKSLNEALASIPETARKVDDYIPKMAPITEPGMPEVPEEVVGIQIPEELPTAPPDRVKAIQEQGRADPDNVTPQEARTELANKRRLFAGNPISNPGGNPMRTDAQRLAFHERIFGKGSIPPLERLKRGQKVASMLPMPPESGPPLPRGLGIRWPWQK